MTLVISDNSALSALAETDMLHVLPAIFGQIVITESVRRECRDQGAPLALRVWIAQPPPWFGIVPDPVSILPETVGLGDGEATSITLAWEHRPGSYLILDEKRGRRVAKALGLSMFGVMAIIADAANHGLVDFDETLQRLIAAGFHVSEAVIAEVRQRLAQ